jgi:hypothetical protein
MFSALLALALSSQNSKCRRWARPLNYTLVYYGYYEAVEKVALYVCQNDAAPAECRPKMVSRLMRWPLDNLIDKGSQAFCAEIIDKNAATVANRRPPACNWCRGAVASFQAALTDRGKEGALNLTQKFCAETERIEPELVDDCPAVTEGFWKPHTGNAIAQRDAVCLALCKPPRQEGRWLSDRQEV